jgi:alkaline phosphatase D
MRPDAARNPVIASELCGTSITSPSRPQARTAQYVAMNPHIKFGRSDMRGFMLLNVTPNETTALFLALADVHDPASTMSTLAGFVVRDGRPGIVRA